MNIKPLLFILVLVMLVCTSCENYQKHKTLKLAHGLDASHPVHKAMVLMAEELEKNSGGNIKTQIFPNQQLGSERQCLELLQIGSLDMTKVSAAVMENFSPNMRVLGMPFLFRDRAHSFEVLDGAIGKELLDGGQKFWLKGLGYYDAGSRSFYTKDRPINTPDDLKGKKIRVMESVTAMDMIRNMGGSPTPISYGELYTALQQGVVDGAENNPPSFYLSRHYEVCKFYSLNEHTTVPDVLVISTHFWKTLNDEEKGWVQAAVDKSVIYQRKLWAISETEALEAVKKEGVEVIIPDKKPFEESVESLYESYKNEVALYNLIKRIKKA